MDLVVGMDTGGQRQQKNNPGGNTHTNWKDILNSKLRDISISANVPISPYLIHLKMCKGLGLGPRLLYCTYAVLERRLALLFLISSGAGSSSG